jgi:hypothetical protein
MSMPLRGSPLKLIRFTHHALEQCVERGAKKNEVIEVVRKGSRERAKRGRELCRLNFQFDAEWNGRYYAIKQVLL